MEKLITQLENIIGNTVAVHSDSGDSWIGGEDEAAEACANLTVEKMIGFAEWVREERYSKYFGNDTENCNKWYVQYTTPDRTYYTTRELVELYLKTL